MSALSSPFLCFFEIPCHLFLFFERNTPSTPKSGLRWFLCWPSRGDQGSLVIFRSAQSDPFISSIKTSTMITYSNSLYRERDAHSLGRRSTARHYRFRALPRANRTRVMASTRGHCATSSTSEPPSFVPSLPWQCSVAGAWPGVDSGAASPRYNVRRPVLPPPTRNAIRNCLASLCAPIVVCHHWSPRRESVPRSCRSVWRNQNVLVS